MLAVEQLEQLLRGASLRVTRPRVAVLGVVHTHPHADTHSILGFVRDELEDVSQQAVYDAHAQPRQPQPAGGARRDGDRVVQDAVGGKAEARA